ncbi:transcription initiation factor TFIID subunit 3-like [Ostrinia furnacalis]|uniref:transcription initiation factor TFIID subunit 3-like n=1 Tax=Ostrinia furnacalis TaxID=93504 RepID=UPI00103AEC31|nr:transcription initiation factor TFIID subunit 3-like [Ostrinia furnacalis]
MDCAYCNRSTEGCASIKCSLCASQFHLECVSSEHLVPSNNSWRCCKCEAMAAAALAPPVIDSVRA